MARSVVSVWGDGWGVFRLPGDLRGDLMDLRGDLMGRRRADFLFEGVIIIGSQGGWCCSWCGRDGVGGWTIVYSLSRRN
mgnify:CR=1 FL=1